MFVNNLGSCLQGAHDLPALAIHALLGEQMLSGGASPSARWSWVPLPVAEVGVLNESGVLEELDEDLVDKLVLSDGLDHEHPLLPEEPQHHGHFHLFIMLQAVDHQLRKNDHAGPPHTSAAVDNYRGVQAPGAFQHAVGVAPD